jgi:lysophospholipase L1-like esterase
MKVKNILAALACAATLSAAAQSPTPAAAQAPKENLRLAMPKTVYAVPGHEINIYFDNIILTPNIKNYLIDVDCKYGRHDQDRWRFTPNDSTDASFPVKITVSDASGKTLGEASSTVRVTPANAGAGKDISVLVIGDSLTDASAYPKEMARLFKAEGNPSVKFIGSHAGGGKTPAEGDTAHEGRGGWTWAGYCERWTDDPKDKPYRQKSPFLVMKDGKPTLDFNAYLEKYNGGKAPDFIIVFLGINDIFGAKDENVDQTIDRIFQSADKLLGEFKKTCPNVKIGLGLTPPPAGTQDAFGSNYGCGQTRWQYCKNQRRLVERMTEKFQGSEKDNIFLVPLFVNINCADNYPKVTEPVNAGNSAKVTRDSNGVHPAAAGYNQIADSFYYWLKSAL